MIDLKDLEPYVIDPSLEGKIFWFYGGPGTRKTTIASKFPKSLIIASEKGYKFINGVKKVDVQNWSDIRQIYRQLKDEEIQGLFKTIVFDRADTIYDYCKEYICKTNGIKELGELAYSQGYTKARKEFNSVIKGIESLGYGIVFITHDKVDMNKLTTQDLENTAAKVIRAYSDFIFLLRRETIDDHDTVMAYTQLVSTDSKSRARYFTKSFEFTFDNLQKELKLAIDKQIEMEGIEVMVQETKVKEERSFESVRDSVINLYTQFQQSGHSALSDIENVIQIQMQGTRISQANESYYDQLLTIETYMLGIE